ncbi:MAG TPA: Kdo hydroxylase family protein, partial [Gemmataceae bacterium]
TGLGRLLNGDWTGRCPYDAFMLGLHHWLKGDEDFQERARRRVWEFGPGAAWLLFADGLSHAVLRGRCALEHSYFVPLPALSLPEESPLALLERAGAPARRAA